MMADQGWCWPLIASAAACAASASMPSGWFAARFKQHETDAASWPRIASESFDRILVDAPAPGLGTLAAMPMPAGGNHPARHR